MAIERRRGGTATVLKVDDGRGFIVKSRGLFKEEWLVITAAHCLPRMPPAHPAAYTEEQTYAKLLGPLQGECTVWAECRFLDPIADIAVLGQPDDQALCEEAEAYDQLVEAMTALLIGAPPPQKYKATPRRQVMGYEVGGIRHPVPGLGRACVLTLDGQWRECGVHRHGGWLSFDQSFAPGMSGSPILNGNGRAIGVVSTEHLNPVLVDRLPLGLLRSMAPSLIK